MLQNFDGNSLANKMMGNGIREEKKNSKKDSKYGSSRHSKGKPNNTHYVGAPYNFVPFTDQVYKYPENKQAWHDDVSDSLLTGEIEYEITANTPIIIDDGKGNFYQTADGTYAIPGSSVRGLIRNNVQILGLSSFSSDIDDYALMYRNVASGAEKTRYSDILGAYQIPIDNGDESQKISILKNVKAGYIAKENGKYKIYQTAVDSIKNEYGEMNYYALSERKIVHEYLQAEKAKAERATAEKAAAGNAKTGNVKDEESAEKTGNKGKFSYEFFIRNGKSIMQHTCEKEFEKKENGNRVQYTADKNKDYKPYSYPVSYEISNLKDVQAVGWPNKYSKKGYAVSSGAMSQKKVIYIIPEIDRKKDPIGIPEEDILSFKIDFEKKKNILKTSKNQEFFNLPNEGETKPVFYIQLGGKLYFGFTPRLRIFYDHSIRDGLPEGHKEQILDYSSAIFGYSTKKESFKSKVSFSDARVVDSPTVMNVHQAILAEPKPTSYLDYLIQDSETKTYTYNSDNLRLRGVKQYWLQKEAHPQNVDPSKKEVATKFSPLDKGTTFKGKIRYKNLAPDELGLLLWSIQLEKGKSRMNIGKAKPIGYGNITMAIKSVKKLDKGRAYALDGILDLDPFTIFTDADIENAIQTYKDAMKDYLGREIDQLPSIRDFFLMKDQYSMPDEKTIKYMSIDNGDYQNRTRVQKLKSVEETIRR